jgi:hypothetical protein
MLGLNGPQPLGLNGAGHLAPVAEGHLAPRMAIDNQVGIASSHER